MALYQAGGGLNAEAIARLRGRQAGHTSSVLIRFNRLWPGCVCVLFKSFFKYVQIFIDELSMGTDRFSFRYCECSLPSILANQKLRCPTNSCTETAQKLAYGFVRSSPANFTESKKPTNQDTINRLAPFQESICNRTWFHVFVEGYW